MYESAEASFSGGTCSLSKCDTLPVRYLAPYDVIANILDFSSHFDILRFEMLPQPGLLCPFYLGRSYVTRRLARDIGTENTGAGVEHRSWRQGVGR